MRAGVYVRISRDTADGAGVDRQEQDCRALADREGWDIVAVYRDNSVSAFTGKDRPAFTRMLTDARDGHLDVVVAWHDDRLWRSVVEQQAVTAMLAEVGVGLIATPTRTYRTDSVDDGFLVGLQALLAQRESAHSGRRKRRQKQQLAEQGRDNGGWRAFGYQPDRITPDPEEAAHLHEAHDHIVNGGSIIALCDRWNRDGVTTSKGARWQPSVLKRLLINPRLAGLRVHNGTVVGPATWEPIFTAEQHERLKAELARPERTRPGPARRYLLTGGIAVCGRCGADMHAQRRSNGTRSYKCYATAGNYRGCGSTGVVADPLDDLVARRVMTFLDGDGLAAALATAAGEDQRRADVLSDLQEAERRLQDLEVAHFADGTLSRAGYLAAREKLTGRIDGLRRQLDGDSRLGVLTGLPSDPEQRLARWDAADVGWRRQLVEAVVDKVVVLPAGGRRVFTPERVRMTWRV